MHKVDFLAWIGLSGFIYELLSVAKGGDFSDEGSLTRLGVYEQASILLSSIDIDSFDYGVRICKAGICEEVAPMQTDALETLPVVCN